MFKKGVQRVPVTPDPESDLAGLIDLIEIQLDLSTGRKSVRSRLSEFANELEGGNRVLVLDVVGRLAKIEECMRANGFETARDTSTDQTSE